MTRNKQTSSLSINSKPSYCWNSFQKSYTAISLLRKVMDGLVHLSAKLFLNLFIFFQFLRAH